MRIGIDISQLAYENTGVANYLKNLVEQLLAQDSTNEYVLFYAGFRRNLPESKFWEKGGKIRSGRLPTGPKLTISQYKLPPKVLDFLWNKLHIVSIEAFIGNVDIFITSDWTEPPTKKAKKATILYDLIVYKYPEETAEEIVTVQKRKLHWVKKESEAILCISEATKKDAMEILQVPEKRLHVIYPGF
ncbi:MAG: glycosyltransferase [Patescibacteria group bacterium]|nr:glycosyltransferase [Patescibacteria group bacterium]